MLAWPPTRYESAELVVHRGPASEPGPIDVRVSGRGVDVRGTLPPAGVLRVPLPVSARCAPGLDACALLVESSARDLRVVLQSPETAGVPDTLARTAHDAVRAPSLDEAGLLHVALSVPNSPDFPEALSFAAVVPVAGAARVRADSGCLGLVDRIVEEGEVLTLGCAAAGEDLTATRIDSDSPVVVLSGNVVAPLPVQAGSGWSADLVLDAPPALEALSAGSSWVAPPLPRAATHAGLGDVVRCAAASAVTVRIRDDAGRDELRPLAAGAFLDLDTADPAGDRVLRLDVDGPVACWHLTKSRVHRGSGDPAAVPLVPRELFTTADLLFAPDGYGERSDLVLVAEAGATVLLDGVPIGGFVPAPGGDLEWAVLQLPPPPAPAGLVMRLEADAPFGAWILGQGGYKAHGLAAARGVPAIEHVVLGGSEPDALAALGATTARSWRDGAPGPRRYYRVDAEVLLRVSACGSEACLDW